MQGGPVEPLSCRHRSDCSINWEARKGIYYPVTWAWLVVDLKIKPNKLKQTSLIIRTNQLLFQEIF